MNTHENDSKLRDMTSRSINYYVPPLVGKLLARIEQERFSRIGLFGFSDAMKWLYRILREKGIQTELYDWRNDFVGYDCGGGVVRNVKEVNDATDILLVLCPDNVNQMRDAVSFLLDNKLTKTPVIYEATEGYNPFYQESPYKEIAAKAKARAISMIEDEKLHNLIQSIKGIAHVPGEVVEFGTFNGGSAAIIVEAVNHFGKKPVLLFDTFKGIPKSRYGLDHRWSGTFSNNSYAQVKNAFKDLDHVQVFDGPVAETHTKVKGPVSFCHIAIDTLESAELLINYIWPMLSPGGMISVDDYGSFPNCLPLTVITDRLLKDRKPAFMWHTVATTGFFAIKGAH